MTDLALTFRKPFSEQVAAFRLRLGNLIPTAKWDDITRAQHDRGFMVAGAMKADLLADLGAAVDKAISQGTSLEEFRADFRRIVAARGWHGWTGEGTKGGEAWRTRVIYKTNMATTYAAGRIAQLVAGKFALWVYRHGGSLEPREQHLAWDGLILPADHPFWETHAPPNGWGCSCYVLGARSMAGARRLGGKPGLALPDDWQAINPRTGTPAGIDKGWDYAPGGSVTAEVIKAVKEKVAKLPQRIAEDLAQAMTNVSVDDDPKAVQDLLSRLIDEEYAHNLDDVIGFANAVPLSTEAALSVGERMALRAYTNVGWHADLTNYQRARAMNSTPEDEDLEHFARLVAVALERLPRRAGTFSRGVPEPPPRLLEYFRNVQPGEQFSFEGVTSFSEAKAFSGDLRFVIQGLSGRSIEFLSRSSHEKEFLFPSGLQFRVLSRTSGDGVITIWAEELRSHRYRDLPQEARHAEDYR